MVAWIFGDCHEGSHAACGGGTLETTKEEREKIVADSLGNIDAVCDGCMAGLAEMYQECIDGKKGTAPDQYVI